MIREMRARLGLLVMLAVALAGCAARDDSPQGMCERQSWNDPDVKLMMQKMVSNDQENYRYQPELDRLRKRALVRCLQAAGIVAPGGVEPVVNPQ